MTSRMPSRTKVIDAKRRFVAKLADDQIRPVARKIQAEAEKRGLALAWAEAYAFAQIGWAAGAEFVNERR